MSDSIQWWRPACPDLFRGPGERGGGRHQVYEAARDRLSREIAVDVKSKYGPRQTFIVGTSRFKLPCLPLDTLRDAFAVDAQ